MSTEPKGVLEAFKLLATNIDIQWCVVDQQLDRLVDNGEITIEEYDHWKAEVAGGRIDCDKIITEVVSSYNKKI